MWVGVEVGLQRFGNMREVASMVVFMCVFGGVLYVGDWVWSGEVWCGFGEGVYGLCVECTWAVS